MPVPRDAIVGADEEHDRADAMRDERAADNRGDLILRHAGLEGSHRAANDDAGFTPEPA